VSAVAVMMALASALVTTAIVAVASALAAEAVVPLRGLPHHLYSASSEPNHSSCAAWPILSIRNALRSNGFEECGPQ